MTPAAPHTGSDDRGNGLKKLLHVVDPTIGLAGLGLLAAVWQCAEAEQQLLIIGHYDGMQAAINADIPAGAVFWHRALGRFDPAVFRAVRRRLRHWQPEVVALWGSWSQGMGRMAAIGKTKCVDIISPSQTLRGRGFAGGWMNTGGRNVLAFDCDAMPCVRGTQWVNAVQGWLDTAPPKSGEVANSGDGEMDAGESGGNHEPEIAARTGPQILLIAGTERHLRVDMALWAAAIVEQINPTVRVLLRLPADRWGVDAQRRECIREFIGNLQSPNLVTMATEESTWRSMILKSDVCVLAADGPVVLAPLLEAAACGIPIVATDTAQLKHGGVLPGLRALAPVNNPRLLAAAIFEALAAAASKPAQGDADEQARAALGVRNENMKNAVNHVLA